MDFQQDGSINGNYGQSESESEYGIRDVAERFDITLRAIRFYEQKGLIAPRREGRARVFDKADVERLQFVQNLRDIGVSIREIKLLLSALDKARDPQEKRRLIDGQVQTRLEEIERERAFLDRQERQATDMLRKSS